MPKIAAAAWLVACLLPLSYFGHKTARSGEVLGIPLSASKDVPRPVVGRPPCCHHPLAVAVARDDAGDDERDDDVTGCLVDCDPVMPNQ